MIIGLGVSIVVDAIVFFGLSKMLPGFKIKDEQAALIASSIYGVSVTILGFLIGGMIGTLILVPLIGPLLVVIAGLGTLILSPIIGFFSSLLVLIITDKFLEDFEMDGIMTAIIASIILGIITLITRIILPF